MEKNFIAGGPLMKVEPVCAQLCISRSTLYEKYDPRSPRYDSTFPRPIKLGAAAIAWTSDSINLWVQSRIAASKVEGERKWQAAQPINASWDHKVGGRH